MKTQLSRPLVSLALPLLAVLLSLASVTVAQVIEHKLIAFDRDTGDFFGRSVSLSEGRALIGAGQDDDLGLLSGSAYIFERQGDGSWIEMNKLTASDGATLDRFGWSVSLSGDRALIGAPGDDTEQGSAYVFERQGDGSWLEVEIITASDRGAHDLFGNVVILLDSLAVISAHMDDDLGANSGSVYMFELQGDASWLEVAKVTASDGAEGDEFGISMSLSNQFVLIGANRADSPSENSGSAYVFEQQGDGAWLEVAMLTASDASQSDRFGNSVALDSTRAIIGAPQNDDLGSESGSAYVFERQSDGSWLEVNQIFASDGASFDFFGNSASLLGERTFLGAWQDKDNGEQSGSVYEFQRQANGTWLEVSKIIASDGAAFDHFGVSLSLSTDHVLVGAENDDDFRGAAYIYDLVPQPPPLLTITCTPVSPPIVIPANGGFYAYDLEGYQH